MADRVDEMLTDSVLIGVAGALDDIAGDLMALHKGWCAMEADSSALEWLESAIAKAGWWRGRIESCLEGRTGRR